MATNAAALTCVIGARSLAALQASLADYRIDLHWLLQERISANGWVGIADVSGSGIVHGNQALLHQHTIRMMQPDEPRVITRNDRDKAIRELDGYAF
jgi:hypothetical protein